MENDSYSALLELVPQLPHHANSLKKILVAPTQTQFKPTSIKEHLSQVSPPPHPLILHSQFYGASRNWWPAGILGGSKLTGKIKSLQQSTEKRERMPVQHGPRAQLWLLPTQLRALYNKQEDPVCLPYNCL